MVYAFFGVNFHFLLGKRGNINAMARLATQSIDHLLSLVQNDPDPFIPFKVRYTALGRLSVVWGTVVVVHCTHHTIPYLLAYRLLPVCER